jgi:hypothetical protein
VHALKQGEALTRDEVLKLARLDAETAYRDLSRYYIRIALEADGWHVDFELNNPRARGGGPHYLIDPANGTIKSKHYEQ